MDKNLETIYLGGGCFWCLEAVFQKVKGVEKIVSGYSGGNKEDPTYEEVCDGTTGHAEVVEIVFDKNQISFETILDIFFDIHDPTSLNKQGNDIGTQYRSIILVTLPEQLALSLKKVADLNSSAKFSKNIVTEIKKFEKFFPAEEYHQNYFLNNPHQPYCMIVVNPKLQKFLTHYPNLIKN